jgi:hypothetical protein
MATENDASLEAASHEAASAVDDAEAEHWRDVLRAVRHARPAGEGGGGGGVSPMVRCGHRPCAQFRDYAAWMAVEERRRASHEAALPARHRALLADGALERKAAALRSAIVTNAALLQAIADEQEEGGFGPQMKGATAGGATDDAGDGGDVGAVAVDGTPLPTTSAAHFSKVRSTLHQLARDWGTEGQAERELCYGPMIAQLRAWLPVTAANVNVQKVCCPGSGLGRLVWECARLGYAGK